MELEEAIRLLKEMQENCKNKTIYKDEKAEVKAEAIERVLRCCETSNEDISREIDNLRACFHEGVEKRNLKIDYLLKELDKKDKEIEYLKKNQRLKKDFNGEKIFCLEYDKETLRDMVLEKQEEIKELKSNSIPKDKIRELLENNYDISTENSRSISVEGAFAFVDDIEELLEEGKNEKD